MSALLEAAAQPEQADPSVSQPTTDSGRALHEGTDPAFLIGLPPRCVSRSWGGCFGEALQATCGESLVQPSSCCISTGLPAPLAQPRAGSAWHQALILCPEGGFEAKSAFLWTTACGKLAQATHAHRAEHPRHPSRRDGTPGAAGLPSDTLGFSITFSGRLPAKEGLGGGGWSQRCAFTVGGIREIFAFILMPGLLRGLGA